MNKRILYFIWGVFFVFCAVLGFIPPKDDIFSGLLIALSIGFFIPPALLLYRSIRKEENGTTRLIAILSGCSLVLSAMLLVLNIMTVGSAAAVGQMLYYILSVVSVPMVCMQNWALSLFLWAVLLIVSLRQLRKSKKGK